ncbi:MAG: hypothetical protein FRC54_05220 [bacterium LCO1.1]|uniref:Uncharacterized protein n=1 Tax=Candidatus Weimeria bifida TaxID=2599074 RepID=A0A6N7J147_9FIRM|nr:hypothetical protein [Candidatus Weimeria bifida]
MIRADHPARICLTAYSLQGFLPCFNMKYVNAIPLNASLRRSEGMMSFLTGRTWPEAHISLQVLSETVHIDDEEAADEIEAAPLWRHHS